MLGGLANALINILYPQNCLACTQTPINSNAAEWVCKACLNRIKPNIPPFCLKCGLGGQKPAAEECSSCKDRNFQFDRAFSACIYEEPLKTLIHQFKYNAKLKLRRLFANILITFIENYHLPIQNYDLLLPVPMHPARLREKEINQAQVLADMLHERYGTQVNNHGLGRIQQKALQSNLSFEQRIHNIKGAFKVRRNDEFINKRILVIDDVFTTGSTVSEAASVLKEAGAGKVDVLTLARTQNARNIVI
jgi:ComF family protein